MKMVGSTDKVKILAQFDCISDQVTRRYYLTSDRDLEADVVSLLYEVNTGDPKSIIDFIIWAC